MGVGLGLVALSAPSYLLTGMSLVLLGFSAGLFAVPLNALLQQRSGKEEKGQLIATNNFMNTIGIFLAAAIHWILKTPLHFSPDSIILLTGLVTLAGTAVILYLLPDYFVRFILWLVTHTIYRITVIGAENLPARGPALLVSNHVSFVDALMIGGATARFVRFMLHRDYYDLKSLHWFFRLMHSIPVSATNRRDIVQSLKHARNELDKGHIVCIFAEGAISRVGHLLPFKRGFEKIVEGTNIPIVPVHLDQLWGSIFSFKSGRFFWKRPKNFSYPVTVSFGSPLRSDATVQEVRNAVLELESDAIGRRESSAALLHAKFIRMAKRRWFSFCMADTTGTELSYGKSLIGSLLLSTLGAKTLCCRVDGGSDSAGVRRRGADQHRTSPRRKNSGQLNFTAGSEAMDASVEQCAIKTIITSRVFFAKAERGRNGGHGFSRRDSQNFYADQKNRRDDESFPLAPMFADPPLRQSPEARRSRHRDFFQRQHRRAQRRHAVASQHCWPTSKASAR